MASNVLLIFILGASIGSFINVLVYRVPQKKSIVFTRSKCTKCENSWLVLIISQLLVGFYWLVNAENVKLISLLIAQ